MSKWNVVRIGDHIKIKHGYAFEGEGISDVDNGKILVTPGNFDIGGGFKSNKFKFFSGSVPEEYILKAQDLVVTMTDLSKEGDTLGYPAFIPANPRYAYLHNQRIGKIIFDDGAIDKGFLYYLFCTKEYRHEVLASATGTSIKHTSPKRIETFSTAIPSIAEQKAIASILGALDDKIELNRRMNATLEAMALALFKSWFVDFDPVRAKSEGRQPFGMDAETAALFPSHLAPSTLGDIPEGWETGRLLDILELSYGKSLTKEDRQEGIYPVYGSGGINGFHSQALVSGPGIIVGRKGTVGSLYWEDRNFFPIDTVFYVAPLKYFSLAYIYPQLERLGLSNMNTDAAVPGLNRENAYRLDVVIPPEPLIDEYTSFATTIRNKMSRHNRETSRLEITRDYLLPKLISGDIRISDAEKFVEAA